VTEPWGQPAPEPMPPEPVPPGPPPPEPPVEHHHRVAVGDLLSWLDSRVTELHAALLEGERHPSRVPGSPVRMSGLDALVNTDATAFRTLTELSARMDRIEEKLDRLLER
jgi:hypothetical protein